MPEARAGLRYPRADHEAYFKMLGIVAMRWEDAIGHADAERAALAALQQNDADQREGEQHVKGE